MAERRVKVTTEVGIQAKPATVFVDTAAESSSEVKVGKPGTDSVDAKSILLVLVLDVRAGDEIVLTGDDEAVLDRLAALVTKELDPGGAEVVDIDD
ncbi:HPr family phosphocarrier protein [Glycomyces buryatensis]|uniref:HPr family phosphocarrier protein n=1 Tax=Glycomyces buryatensis TaxID=2570927 RepID=A0A4S8QAH9_9ACTN|nr:HPr family phosphocarrier protein [Glycomyces buryatensis]THV41338.1 HPr family phosphocarrier protein [Glycomyces buryatensis]